MRTIREVCEAIPPAYTEHVGHYLMAELTSTALTPAVPSTAGSRTPSTLPPPQSHMTR